MLMGFKLSIWHMNIWNYENNEMEMGALQKKIETCAEILAFCQVMGYAIKNNSGLKSANLDS